MAQIKEYKRAIRLEYKGVQFDSLLELRFILIIEDKCSWIKEPKTIFYDPETFKPITYLKENTKKYTPDFLVRKWKDNSAHLIELKPREFKDSDQMKIRNQVVINYILENNLDWKFVILSKEDLTLNDRLKMKFKEIIEKNKSIGRKSKLLKLDKKYNNTFQHNFSCIPNLKNQDITKEDYIRYVKYGKLPDEKTNINPNRFV